MTNSSTWYMINMETWIATNETLRETNEEPMGHPAVKMGQKLIKPSIPTSSIWEDIEQKSIVKHWQVDLPQCVLPLRRLNTTPFSPISFRLLSKSNVEKPLSRKGNLQHLNICLHSQMKICGQYGESNLSQRCWMKQPLDVSGTLILVALIDTKI